MAIIDISAKLLGDKKMVRLLGELSNEKAEAAIKSGISQAARGAKKDISMGLRAGGLNLKSGRIKEGLKEPRFQAGGLQAIVYASHDPVTALSFGAKQNSKGLGVTFYKGQRQNIARGFIAKGMPLAGVPGRRWPAPKAVRFIHGPSISQAYLNGQKAGTVKPLVEEKLEESLVKGIMRRLDGFARGF